MLAVGLAHRRLDFDHIDAAESLRADFEAKGWKASCLLWMRHEGPSAARTGDRGRRGSLRRRPPIFADAWHREDFPDQDPAEYHAQARDVALRRGACGMLTVREGRAPVAFAQTERDGAAAEITHVYVHQEYREPLAGAPQ